MAIPNEIIRASAGTGKTFALSDRIVRLLALGVAPETLVALTFTRKAAAEFAAAVFRKLAEAALDEKTARELAARLELGPRTSADFATTLRAVVAAMNRLQFGTLDAFFQRIAGTIPFELGLSGPIQILDQAAADESRARALQGLLHANVDEINRRTLLDAFRAATWGAEEKQLFPRLLGFIDSGHDLFLEAPSPAAWGREQTIWPKGCAWLPPPADITNDVERLLEFAETLAGRFAAAVRKFAVSAGQWQPGMDLPDDTVTAQIFALLAGADVTEAIEVTYYRKPCLIPGKWVPHFQRIVRHSLGASLAQAVRAARGMHHLLADYDRHYETEIRRTGRLAFADVIELLRRVEPAAWQPRLDSRLAHWLFDEFQDTSIIQWTVLADLVDEVLQDPSGERSVFFVGDPKQAIYRWRGGEHRLLGRIASRYGAAIQTRPLDRSYRSAPAIIDFVNRVGAAVATCEGRLPDSTIEEWRMAWSPHVSAVTASKGNVQILEVAEKEDLHEALFASLQEVDPIGRGLTCAILVRGNDEAAEIAEALRARGFLDVAAETDVSVVIDQPLTQALLALISAATHPGDVASRRIVEMSPLSRWLDEAGSWSTARRRVLHLLTTHGYEAALHDFLDATPDTRPGGRFATRRIEQLLEIARGYDAGRTRNHDEFVRLARDATRRETASAGRVQVMTIHKSKGLGFDFVLLPMRVNRRLDAVESDPLLVSRDENRFPEWILGRPSSAVIEADPILRAAQDKRRADAAYESLCVLYVALTRARFGLHIFVGPPSANESSLSATGLIREAIADPLNDQDSALLWQHGDARWFENPLRETPILPPLPSRADWASLRPTLRGVATRPSAGRTEVRLESPSSSEDEAIFLGADIHKAFAAIEWDDGPGSWPKPSDPEISRVVSACLAEPAIARLFQRPSGVAEVWRERAFDIVLDRRWVSGVFDRVILTDDEALLVEFKTGSARQAEMRHAPQIELYRAALAKLTGGKTVRAFLVLTATRTVTEIIAAQK